jgi:hypothetical protein
VRKKKSLPRNTRSARYPKPLLAWQTGEYQRHLTLRLAIPQQLLLLCKLMDVTPRQLIADFMENLAGESLNRETANSAREKLTEYFVEQRYGGDRYSHEQIIAIFRELNAISMLYPLHADNSFVDFHAQWRERYQAFWFDKWMEKAKMQTRSHLQGQSLLR